MNPSNPRILYAAMWQAGAAVEPSLGRAGSGLYRARDGGDTWVELSEGLPEGVKGRIAVAVSPAAPDRVWALVEAEEGGLYRSDDGGEKFRLVSADRELRQRAWYYTHLEADPRDADTVCVLNVIFSKSIDGGEAFVRFAPRTATITGSGSIRRLHDMIQSNDGGANITFNGGGTWSPRPTSRPPSSTR